MTDHQNENNRAKNFVLHIPEEEMQYGAPSESGEKESLSSFSDGHPRKPTKKRSKRKKGKPKRSTAAVTVSKADATAGHSAWCGW